MISPKPYTKLVPFVNFQEIRVDTTDDQEFLSISLLVSNEIGQLRANVRFSNYCILTSNREEIKKFTSPNRVAALINDDRDATRTFLLQSGDFTIKVPMNPERGTSVYNSTYVINKTVPETKNLYAIIVSYYKLNNEEIILGNVCTEIILSAGQTPTKSALYRVTDHIPGYGPERSIWPGAVHLHNDELMTGDRHSSNADHPTLEKSSPINVKIKDMRLFRQAAVLSMDPEPLSSKVPYLSEITLSRNLQGNVHGIFSFAHLLFAKENTKYGRNIKNKISLLSAAPVEDIIIYQRVVKEDSTGNSLTPGRPSYCGIQTTTYFKKVASLSSGLQIVSGFNNNEILNIAFVDTTTQENEANMLEYKVELLLSDKTKEAIELVTGHISDALARQKSEGPSAKNLKNLIDVYLTGVTYIFGASAFGNLSALSWQQKLLALIAGGEPDADLVTELIRSFSVGISDSIKPSQSVTSTGADNYSRIYRSNNDSTSRLVRVFPRKLKISYRKSIGFEYIDNTIINASLSIPTIGYTTMNQRISDEVSKYAVNNPSAGSINQPGYLTPVAIHLRANPVVVSSTTLENSTDNFAALIRSEIQLNAVVSLEPAKDLATNIIEILSQTGVGTTQNNTNLIQMVQDTQIASPNLISSDNYFPSTTGFTQLETPLESASSGSSASIVINSTISSAIVSSPLLNQMVNQIVCMFTLPHGLSNTGSISGSLPLQRWIEDPSIISNSDAMTNLVNFGAIVQVQYLAEYSSALGVARQNWTHLTKTVYNNASSTQRSLLCRLVLISGTLDAQFEIDLPTLASLFILGPPPTPPGNQTYRQTFNAFTTQFRNSNRESLKYLKSSDILYANNMPIYSSKPGADTGNRY